MRKRVRTYGLISGRPAECVSSFAHTTSLNAFENEAFEYIYSGARFGTNVTQLSGTMLPKATQKDQPVIHILDNAKMHKTD